MKKESALSLLQSIANTKKVDVKVSNKKYAITFNQPKHISAKPLDPSLLSVNGQKEIRVMVNAEQENVEAIVEQVKTVFTDYMKDIAKKDFVEKQFDCLVCQFQDYDEIQQMMGSLRVEKNKMILISDDGDNEAISYETIRDVYIEKRSVVENKYQGNTKEEMQYRLSFDNWMVVECDAVVLAFYCEQINDVFMTLSKAYFMSQMKKEKKVYENE